MMSRRHLALAAALALALGWLARPHRAAPPPRPTVAARAPTPEARRALGRLAEALAGSGPVGAWSGAEVGADPGGRGPAAGEVVLTGEVVDLSTRAGVEGLEVVFSGPDGERSTTAGPGGAYRIAVPAGRYRAFVRDDGYLSVGVPPRERLPGPVDAAPAGAPDEALLPVVVAAADTPALDLGVLPAGIIEGRVVDAAGRPVRGAAVGATPVGDGPLAALGALRPALRSDVAETDASGRYQLRLALGAYALDASHPDFAGVRAQAGDATLPAPRARQTVDLTLDAGCVISGRVVAADGGPAGDGALERRYGEGPHDYAPAGRIEADGRFRWTVVEPGEVTLRAWPWKAPPSPPRTFACRPGARFADIEFRLPARAPDLAGVLVDAHGAPVPFAHVDVRALDGGPGQQERTDAEGRWAVFDLAPGRYALVATAPGQGATHAVVASPATDVRLALGGTGRLEGEADLVEGAFLLVLERCDDDEASVGLDPAPRLVTVRGGRFAVDGVPACRMLAFHAERRGRVRTFTAAIPAGGSGHVVLDLEPPPPVVVSGVVTAPDGRPAALCPVEATLDDGAPAMTTTDVAGRYELRVEAGATISAYGDAGGASGVVPEDARGAARIDLRLAVPPREEEPGPDGEEVIWVR